MFRASINSLPGNIQKLFLEQDTHHGYNLRGRNKLYQNKVRTSLKSRCISVKGVQLWNSLSEEVTGCRNLAEFKTKFKQAMMQKYQAEEN